MNREAQITFRAPKSFKNLLARRAKSAGWSMADEVIALCYEAVFLGPKTTQVPADLVWDNLLKNAASLPSRNATAAEQAEFGAYQEKVQTGNSRPINAAKALAILGAKPSRPDLLNGLRQIQAEIGNLIASA